MRLLSRIVMGVAGLAVLGLLGLWLVGQGLGGGFDSEQLEPTAAARSRQRVEASDAKDIQTAESLGASDGQSQILFGDLHVHTTISFDAFMLNLPLMGGEGAHTPADACDFARHCAALDFYSLNDHAANIHPEDWRNSIESIRQCNALAGEVSEPDMVAFLGWEWTQAGATPSDHYGHKNVVLAGTDDHEIPSRPIAATAGGTAARPPSVFARGLLALQGERFRDLALRWTELSSLNVCPDAPVRELPEDCREIAPTPAELFRKLDEWGHDSLVIPHGTAWGIYTPPGSSWDQQLSGSLHDASRQRLIEVYSGHGNSEPYRPWLAVERDAAGNAICPEESDDYLPMCRRAGQIVQARCLEEGSPQPACEARAERARQNAVAAGVSPHVTVPGATTADWLDAGQCRDCGQPSFKYRPRSSAQYVAAIGNFDQDGEPRHFRMGFIASSDIHTARAGTGYKELRFMTDAGNRRMTDQGGLVGSFLRGPEDPPSSLSRSIEEAREKLSGLQLFESERTQSFLYTGGLVAVHSAGRSREEIWDALMRREVYGTSGPRILLHFDALAGQERYPMGSEIELDQNPQFEVRATGSFEQLPGCPTESAAALGPESLARLCRGECYHPSDQRRLIDRIEIVRIRPQNSPAEAVEDLIDDPWQSVDCAQNPEGCVLRVEDTEFTTAARDTLYYARVFESPVPTVNGSPLQCQYDERGRCVETDPCERGEECTSPDRPRAWSSPIWVDYSGPRP
ncbi:MAG: DUF3604 domain-containing protein [Myxococcota bacterium]